MIKFHRIWAVLLRFIFMFKHSLDRLADIFYWPTLDLVLWGLTSSFFAKISPGSSGIVLAIISGVLFWTIVWRAQIEISVGLLEDVWEKNYINIFSTPLKFSEWLSALLILGISRGFISLAFASFLAFVFYKIQIFIYGFYILPFAAILLLAGWCIGFLVTGFILRYGTKIQIFAWAAVALVSPFSAVFYPLSILPPWAQNIAKFIPTSYVFEGMREVAQTGVLDWNKIYISGALSIFYLVVSLLFLKLSFNKLLQKGITKLY